MPADRFHLASFVDDFEKLGSQVAIVEPHGVRLRRTTYQELAQLSRRFASELQQRQIGKGDRVLLWASNGQAWIATFFGCVLNGTLPVPIDATSSPLFAQSIAAEVAPKLIVSELHQSSFLPSNIPALFIHNLEAQITQRTNYHIPPRTESDLLQILFTSGTTGQPKGIVHTHKNVLASVCPIEAEMQKYLRYERPFHPIRILHTLPLSHVFGQFMGLWIPALLGAELHLRTRLVASELIAYIRSKRISVLAAVPRILDLLQSELLDRFPALPARLEASSQAKALARWWRFRDIHAAFSFKFWAFVCGGASLSPASEHFWSGLGFPVIQGYGMTETTALVSLNHPFKLARGTVGQVLPGREVQLSPEGEVLVRGETVSNLTWQDGQTHQSASDWLPTGDLAELDSAGNLRFRGRQKEVIVTTAGLNIHPSDLEEAILAQPGVTACAVIESQGANGPRPLAVLILRIDVDAAHVIAEANRHLAAFQQVEHWLEWPEPDLPRTASGKVLKRDIAERLQSGHPPTSIADTKAGELELDSLGRVQLQAQLESRYGIALDDAAVQQVRTETDLQDLIRQREKTSLPRSPDRKYNYPRWPWSFIMQSLRSVFLETIAIPLVRLLVNPRVVSPLAAPDCPVLIVANHLTSYDVPLLLYALPGPLRRRVAVAMSGEMILDWRMARHQASPLLNGLAPWQYWLVTALFNIFPLPQRSGFHRSFEHAGEAMDQGYSVLVFPEGRRADDTHLQAFKTGSGLLWKELDAPVLPLYLSGLGELKVSGQTWFRSGTVSIVAGPILPPPSVQETPGELTGQLHAAVVSLESKAKQLSKSKNRKKLPHTIDRAST